MVLDTNVCPKPRSVVELMHIRPSKRIHQPRSDHSFCKKELFFRAGFLSPLVFTILPHESDSRAEKCLRKAANGPPGAECGLCIEVRSAV